ncbi:MAG: hypothetical protein LC748_02015 [Thermomicrobia bacterium]|nr:hypothetical protein [Thermomicrobia bacterium]
MSPQLVTAAVRGAVVTLLVALITFGTLYGSGADQRAIVAGIIAAAVPVALGFLGYGFHDQQRAVQVAKGNLDALHPADVGYARAINPSPPVVKG